MIYFGFQSASPRRKPSVPRLIISFLVVVVVVVGLLASGYPNAAFVIVLGAVVGAGKKTPNLSVPSGRFFDAFRTGDKSALPPSRSR
jgi:hypothetical protein